MSDLRTLKRGRVWPHARWVQGRLSISSGDEEATDVEEPECAPAPDSSRTKDIRQHAAASACPPPVFHPLEYRNILATWPVQWRARWGRRSNELEEGGLSWRDAEAQAFVEVWNIYRKGQAPPSADLVLAPSSAERN